MSLVINHQYLYDIIYCSYILEATETLENDEVLVVVVVVVVLIVAVVDVSV